MNTINFERINQKSVFEAGAINAQWWRKTASVLARPAQLHERVTTIVDGVVETSNNAQSGDMVVQNPGGEQYLVLQAKFASKYEIADNQTDDKGFRRYFSVSHAVPCVHLDRNVEFDAPWGEIMRVERGGYLVRTSENDVYGIQKNAFLETYLRCYPDGRLLSTDAWAAAYSAACKDAYDDFHHSRVRLADAQVEARALRQIDKSLVGVH